mgnify:CR=1 FL=1
MSDNKRVFLLDFDGVLCNSLDECLIVSYNTYYKMDNNTIDTIPMNHRDYFYENRKISVGEAGEKVKRAGEIAKEKGFVVSGGGDFHSDVDPHEIGDYGVSLEEFGKLRKYWGEKWGK